MTWLQSLAVSPELIFSICVLIIFAFFWMGVFILLYHLSRFGIGLVPRKYAVILLLGSVIIFSMALTSYSRVDITDLSSLVHRP